MRVIKVLFLLAFFFVVRYSLNDKRTMEIKELLRQRNTEKNGGTVKT